MFTIKKKLIKKDKVCKQITKKEHIFKIKHTRISLGQFLCTLKFNTEDALKEIIQN